MSINNYRVETAASTRLTLGDIAQLRPMDSLPDDAVLRGREAAARLDALAGDPVYPVVPTGFASAMFLAKEPVTLVAVDELPDTHQEAIRDVIDETSRAGVSLRLGGERAFENHAPSEFVGESV